MSSNDVDKIIESLDRAKRGIRRQSALERTLSFIDNINKKPPPVQMAVGGTAGLCVGYIFTRTSKAAATALGVSLIAFQGCRLHQFAKTLSDQEGSGQPLRKVDCLHIPFLHEVFCDRDGSTMLTPEWVEILQPYLKWAVIPAALYSVWKLCSYLVPGPHHHPRLSFKDKSVLITGASTGLGRALAFELYGRGAKLILTARSIDKLRDLCEELKNDFSGNPHEPSYSYLDVCEPMDVESLKKHAIDGKTIHVLINNAGLSMRGAIEHTPIKIYKQLMDVNFFGHVVVTQKLLDAIPDDGCIIATSSVQGKVAIPYRSAYSASKHAFQAFFDALRCEARPNLHILTVSAGYMNTGFGSRALGVHGQPVGKEDENQRKVCNYRGYVKLNRTKFEKDVLDLKRGLEKKLLGKTESMIPDEQEIGSFLRSNAWLLTGFAAGWLLGFGIA